MLNEIRQKTIEARHSLGDALKSAKIEAIYRSPKELSDFELLEKTDPHLAKEIGPKLFYSLKQTLEPKHSVLDIGAGINPLRGIIFFDAGVVVAADPAYEWYEAGSSDTFSYPHNVFGGEAMRDELIDNLKTSLKRIKKPSKIEGKGVKNIDGIRKGRERLISLIPQGASELSEPLGDQFFGSAVVWRAFLPADTWGKVIASTKVGGYILTTGFGDVRPLHEGEEETTDFEELSCGVNIDNSPLPRNGNTEAIGLRPLTDLENIYLYEKIRHLGRQEVASEILRNA